MITRTATAKWAGELKTGTGNLLSPSPRPTTTQNGPCAPGQEPGFDPGDCWQCSPGTFSPTGSTCEFCPRSSYTSAAGASQCVECGCGAMA